MSEKYQKRSYRNVVDVDDDLFFEVKVKETDLYIHGDSRLKQIAEESVIRYRGYIESYINRHP